MAGRHFIGRIAALFGHKEITEFLIKIFIENKINLNETDDDGLNALQLAIERDNKEKIELLNKFTLK